MYINNGFTFAMFDYWTVSHFMTYQSTFGERPVTCICLLLSWLGTLAAYSLLLVGLCLHVHSWLLLQGIQCIWPNYFNSYLVSLVS